MGCASSKPSKSKKDTKKLNKKSKSTDGIAEDAGSTSAASQYGEQMIALDKSLLDQIKKNEAQVVEYIGKLVQRDLHAELAKQSPSQSAIPGQQQDNDDLIIDVTSKAINLLVNTPLPNTTLSYKSLNQSLKNWKFICKNQSNRTRIIDLTSETIVDCLHSINEELKANTDKTPFDLLHFLTNQSTLTPPQTPQKQQSQEEIWNQSAVLLNRTKANQIARLLFLSNKARPVIHPSNRIKDAYFVNRELPDKTQVTISEQEIEDILNNSTYKNNPHITPVTGRKLDMVNDILPKSFSTPEVAAAIEGLATETTNDSSQNDTTAKDTVTNCLDDPSDYEKVECVNLTIESTSEAQPVTSSGDQQITEQVVSGHSVEDSTDTHVIEEAKELSTEAELVANTDDNTNSEFLDNIVNEINNLKASINNEDVTEDTDKLETEATTVTPPTTPEVQPGDEGSVETEKTEAEDTLRTVLTAGADESASAEAGETTKEGSEETATNDSQTVEQENGNMDSVLKQQLLDDRFYNNDEFKSGAPINGSDAQNNAATTIQAGFKGEATRQDETPQQEPEADPQQQFLRQNTVEMKSTLDNFSANMFDDAMEKAATKIQSNIRGYLTRKSLKKSSLKLKIDTEVANKEEEVKVEVVAEPVAEKKAETEEPVQETKSKGKKKRNRKKSPKQNEIEKALEQVLATQTPPDSSSSDTLPSDHEQKAATKIQATFKGYKVRKDMSKEQRK